MKSINEIKFRLVIGYVGQISGKIFLVDLINIQSSVCKLLVSQKVLLTGLTQKFHFKCCNNMMRKYYILFGMSLGFHKYF